MGLVTDEGNGMEKVVLRTEQGASAEVYLHGAHIASWKGSDGKDILFMSKEAIFKPPKAIRGGVPVCFPQFGQLGPLNQHGFVRNSKFELLESNEWSATLVLKSTGTEDAKYPNPFELRVAVHLCEDSLGQKLTVTNTGSDAMEFTCALHTYFKVPDISAVSVVGLDGVTYSDSLQNGLRVTQEGAVTFDREVDRIYIDTPEQGIKVAVAGSSHAVEVRKRGLPDAVVWNPWVAKAKAMADFGDEEYKEMLCIEPALALSGPYKLEAGKTWSGEQVLLYTP